MSCWLQKTLRSLQEDGDRCGPDLKTIGVSFIVPMLPMSARNEQDQGYSQPSLEGLMQPDTPARDKSSQVQQGIFPAGAEQGTEFAEQVVSLEGCQVINPPVVEE